MARTINAMADPHPEQKVDVKSAASDRDPPAAASEIFVEAHSPEELHAELLDTRERLLRALAEQQNIRRQMQRQRDEAVKFAASQLTGDLLDTLDNLRRAIESVSPEASSQEAITPLLKGVETTEQNLLATLSRHGLERIDPLGKPFDPHHHHAILNRPDTTAAEGTIVEVLQPGYMLHGRVLRPAMVGVAIAEPQNGKPG